MHTLLRWWCLLLLPFASLAQTPTPFQLKQVLGTPLENPQDIAVKAQRFIYVLDNGQVTKLSAQGSL